jgi:uncharacterized membrane protein
MAKNKFSETQQKAIQNAIAEAELHTSGEVRVHIASKCKGKAMENAIAIFKKLAMDQTEKRNGVLFYIAMEDHKLAILGDQGINECVPENFWDEIRDRMISHFKQENYTEGLVEGIHMAGQQLKVAFPYHASDINELSDEISFQEDEE